MSPHAPPALPCAVVVARISLCVALPLLTPQASRGVKSVALRPGDEIADMDVVRATADGSSASLRAAANLCEAGGEMLLAVTRGGFGKRMRVDNFSPKGRGGKGMIAIKFKSDEDELIALSQAPAALSDHEYSQLGTSMHVPACIKVTAMSASPWLHA